MIKDLCLSNWGGGTHFILGTKVQPNKAHSMTQVLMNLKVEVKFFQKWI